MKKTGAALHLVDNGKQHAEHRLEITRRYTDLHVSCSGVSGTTVSSYHSQSQSCTCVNKVFMENMKTYFLTACSFVTRGRHMIKTECAPFRCYSCHGVCPFKED